MDPISTVIVSKTLAESLSKFIKENKFEKQEVLPEKVKTKEDIEKIKQFQIEKDKKLPPDQSWRLTEDFVQSTFTSISQFRQERLRQARATFNFALIFTIIGVILIFFGIMLFYLDKISAGIISTSVGAISEVTSVILFKLNKDSNDRLDETAKDLSILERLRIGIYYIDQIKDFSKRDEAIQQLTEDIQLYQR